MTLAIELLSEIPPAPEVATEHGRCAVTGRHLAGPGVRRRDVFSDSFADYHILAIPQSPVVDACIATALGNAFLRYKSWIIQGGVFRSVERRDIRELVQSPPEYPWGCYAALGMRRHGGLLTHASTSQEGATIQFDVHRVGLGRVREIYPRVERLALLGIMRTELAELELHRGAKTMPPPETMSLWWEHVAWASRLREGAAYQLAVWLLPSRDEINAKEAPADE